MRTLQTGYAVFIALTLFEPAAQAQPKPSNLETATELAGTGKADQSLAIVDPIIERAMQDEAKDPKAICPSVAVAVLQRFLKGKATVSVEDDWCEAMLIKAYPLLFTDGGLKGWREWHKHLHCCRNVVA